MQTVSFTGNYQNLYNKFKSVDMAHKSQDYYTKLFREIDKKAAGKLQKAEMSVTQLENAEKPVSNFVKRTQEYYDSMFAEIDEKIAQGGDKNLVSMISGEPAVTFVNPKTGLYTTIYSKDSKKIVTVMDPYKTQGIPHNSELYMTPTGKIHKTERNKTYKKCGILKNSSENSDKYVWTGTSWRKIPKAKPKKSVKTNKSMS